MCACALTQTHVCCCHFCTFWDSWNAKCNPWMLAVLTKNKIREWKMYGNVKEQEDLYQATCSGNTGHSPLRRFHFRNPESSFILRSCLYFFFFLLINMESTHTHTESQNFFNWGFPKKTIVKQAFASIADTQFLPNPFGDLNCLMLHTTSGSMFATIPALNINVMYLQMTGAWEWKLTFSGAEMWYSPTAG